MVDRCLLKLGGHAGKSAMAVPPVRPPVRPTVRISKIVTFINMDITGVKNGSSDMILTPFDGKFHEKKDELPPGVHRLPYTLNFSILGI